MCARAYQPATSSQDNSSQKRSEAAQRAHTSGSQHLAPLLPERHTRAHRSTPGVFTHLFRFSNVGLFEWTKRYLVERNGTNSMFRGTRTNTYAPPGGPDRWWLDQQYRSGGAYLRAVGSLSRCPVHDSTYAQLPGLCEKVFAPSLPILPVMGGCY
jgi:hypothetical protein